MEPATALVKQQATWQAATQIEAPDSSRRATADRFSDKKNHTHGWPYETKHRHELGESRSVPWFEGGEANALTR